MVCLCINFENCLCTAFKMLSIRNAFTFLDKRHALQPVLDVTTSIPDRDDLETMTGPSSTLVMQRVTEGVKLNSFITTVDSINKSGKIKKVGWKNKLL